MSLVVEDNKGLQVASASYTGRHSAPCSLCTTIPQGEVIPLFIFFVFMSNEDKSKSYLLLLILSDIMSIVNVHRISAVSLS